MFPAGPCSRGEAGAARPRGGHARGVPGGLGGRECGGRGTEKKGTNTTLEPPPSFFGPCIGSLKPHTSGAKHQRNIACAQKARNASQRKFHPTSQASDG